jgi:cell division protein ZapA
VDVSPQSVRIKIFGDDYLIKGDVDVDTTKKVAEYVDRQMSAMRKKSASNDKVKVAVLSALNIAGELFDLRSRGEENGGQIGEITRRVGLLVKKIDDAL